MEEKSKLRAEGRWISKRRERQAETVSLKEEGESMSKLVDAKSLQENLDSHGFTLGLPKPKVGKEDGRRRPSSTG